MSRLLYASVIPVAGQFDRIPECLFTNSRYDDLSLAAKLLYSKILTRTSLSLQNGYTDNLGVFVYMSRRTIMELLSCAEQKATAVVKELMEHELVMIDNHRGVNNSKMYLLTADGMTDTEPGITIRKALPKFTFWQLPIGIGNALSEGARLIYAMLHSAVQATKNGIALIQKTLVAMKLKIDPRTVSKYIKSLEAAKLLLPSSHNPHPNTRHQSYPPVSRNETSAINITDAASATHMPEPSGVSPGFTFPPYASVASQPISATTASLIDYDTLCKTNSIFMRSWLDKAACLFENMLHGKEEVTVRGIVHPAEEVAQLMQEFSYGHFMAIFRGFERRLFTIRKPEQYLKAAYITTILEARAGRDNAERYERDRERPERSKPKEQYHVNEDGFLVRSPISGEMITQEQRSKIYSGLIERSERRR